MINFPTILLYVCISIFIYNVKINEIMYDVWIAPLFIVRTLCGRPQTKPPERMEGGKGEKKVKKCREHPACHPARLQ